MSQNSCCVPECAVARRNCMEAEELQSFHEYIKMKEFGNKKWLCYPTRALFDFFAQVEHVPMY